MKHTIIAAGKPALKYAKDGVAEYMKRLSRYGSFQLQHVKDGTSEGNNQLLMSFLKKCNSGKCVA